MTVIRFDFTKFVTVSTDVLSGTRSTFTYVLLTGPPSKQSVDNTVTPTRATWQCGWHCRLWLCRGRGYSRAYVSGGIPLVDASANRDGASASRHQLPGRATQSAASDSSISRSWCRSTWFRWATDQSLWCGCCCCCRCWRWCSLLSPTICYRCHCRIATILNRHYPVLQDVTFLCLVHPLCIFLLLNCVNVVMKNQLQDYFFCQHCVLLLLIKSK